jgi:hypothetical protein
MVETINFSEERKKNSMAYSTLLMTIANNKEQNALLTEVHTPSTLKVTLTINGVEFPFVKTMERWDKEIDRFVANEAKKLIREKFLVLEDKLAKVSDSVDALISEHFPEEA